MCEANIEVHTYNIYRVYWHDIETGGREDSIENVDVIFDDKNETGGREDSIENVDVIFDWLPCVYCIFLPYFTLLVQILKSYIIVLYILRRNICFFVPHEVVERKGDL